METVERWEWGWRMEDVSGGLGAVRDGWAGGGAWITMRNGFGRKLQGATSRSTAVLQFKKGGRHGR